MSIADESSAAVSARQRSNSSSSDAESEPRDSETVRPDVPTVDERVSELKERYPARAFVPISRAPGTKLRQECVEEHYEEEYVEPMNEWEDGFMVRNCQETEALPLVAVVEEFLEWYEGYRGRRGKFSRGQRGRGEYESFTIPLDNSYSADYQNKEYAEIQALFREVAGGERPSGGECPGSFEDPAVMLLSRSASSTPGGEFSPVVDHDRAIADAWDSVYRAMYYHADRLGLEIGEDILYHKQGEPHTGGGAASCYGHDHPVIIVDLAAVDLDAHQLGEELGEPMIDAHVQECEYAEQAAHDYKSVEDYTEPGAESCISVQRVEDLDSAAGYVGKYVSNDAEDLLERDIEYVAWAATQWATNTQKAVRSNAANAAVKADACKQRAESPESQQVRGHGEEITNAAPGAAHDYECTCCGSSWGVDQHAETLVEAKRRNGEMLPDGPPTPVEPDSPSVVADGGVETDNGQTVAEAEKVAQMRDTWQDARSGWSVGEPIGGGETVRVSFRRPARWRFEAVVEADGTENPPSPGGMEMVELGPQTRESVRIDYSGDEPERVGPGEPYQRARTAWVDGEPETVVMRDSEQIYSDEERTAESGPPLEPEEMMFPWKHPDGPEKPLRRKVDADLERVVKWIEAGHNVAQALFRFDIHPKYEDDLREVIDAGV